MIEAPPNHHTISPRTTAGGEEQPDHVDKTRSSKTMSALKTLAACALLYSAFVTWNSRGGSNGSSATMVQAGQAARRQLSMVGDSIPAYMEGLMKDLRERKKLFDETPPEEVKYWFEYTGPLQVCHNAKQNA